MATGTQIEVVMPQMGVSVSEGTITKWLKQPGEAVAQDEALLEISTDKVDTEVPSPGDGIVSEILVGEGQTVEVGTVLAVIAPAGSAGQAGSAPPKATTLPQREPRAAPTLPATPAPVLAPTTVAPVLHSSAPTPVPHTAPVAAPVGTPAAQHTETPKADKPAAPVSRAPGDVPAK